MPDPLFSRATLFAAVAAAGLAALPGSATAQDACTPGEFGEGIDLVVNEGGDDSVTGLSLEFQCGDILEDGTYIPTGYRIHLEGECDGGPCEYPVTMASPQAQEGRYEGSFVSANGENVTLRVRKTRRGAVLVKITHMPGEGNKPERTRYRMQER